MPLTALQLLAMTPIMIARVTLLIQVSLYRVGIMILIEGVMLLLLSLLSLLLHSLGTSLEQYDELCKKIRFIRVGATKDVSSS